MLCQSAPTHKHRNTITYMLFSQEETSPIDQIRIPMAALTILKLSILFPVIQPPVQHSDYFKEPPTGSAPTDIMGHNQLADPVPQQTGDRRGCRCSITSHFRGHDAISPTSINLCLFSSLPIQGESDVFLIVWGYFILRGRQERKLLVMELNLSMSYKEKTVRNIKNVMLKGNHRLNASEAKRLF